MELFFKGCLGAAIAIAFTILGRSGKGEWAGILALFPVFSILGYFLVGSSGNATAVKEMARTSALSLPVLAAFFVASFLLMSQYHWKIAIILALVIWLFLALVWIRWIL